MLLSVQFALALAKSFNSLQTKPMGLWKLMLRDGLNLYGVRFTLLLTCIMTYVLLGHLVCQHGQHAVLVHHEPYR